MKRQSKRYGHRRHDGHISRSTSEEMLRHEYPGEFAHRYSENVGGEQYDEYLHSSNRRTNRNWDSNPGGGSYGYNYYAQSYNNNEQPMDYGYDRGVRRNFRERNTRYRDRVRSYRNRHFNSGLSYETENPYRQQSSIDEHLNRPQRGLRRDNW